MKNLDHSDYNLISGGRCVCRKIALAILPMTVLSKTIIYSSINPYNKSDFEDCKNTCCDTASTRFLLKRFDYIYEDGITSSYCRRITY